MPGRLYRCHQNAPLSLHTKNLYVKPFDPLSAVIPSKNSFKLFNQPKKVPQVEISVLNRDEMVSMAPHFDPYRRQWLQNLVLIGVNGSTFSSKSASMAPEFDPNRCQWLQNFIHIGVNGSGEEC